MNKFLAISTLSLLACTGIATAQEMASAAALQRDVITARVKVATLAQELHADLVALMPSVPGWTCHETDKLEEMSALYPIPSANFNCEHAEHSLNITLQLEASTSELFCRSIATTQQGIADDRVKPGLFRFFEGGGWHIERGSVDLTGCAANVIAFKAEGNRSEAALAIGFAAIDDFAEGFLSSDPAALGARTMAHATALNHLLALLESQSHLLANFIPAPPGATREVILPSTNAAVRLPPPMLLGASPIASADLKIGDCFLHVEMSASPITIHEAKTTSFRWARRGGEDGIVRGAFIRRNTERFVGLEQVDGTGLEVLLDNVVLVRINIQGNHICDSDPEIVSWLFDEIIEDDPARFFLP